MPQWSPEIVVDSALARRLIRERFPELDGAPIEPLGEGWDSTVWLVDSRWVFRFPRREVVVPGFLRETEVLPVLAPDLPLPIPVAAFRGEPGPEFPWPWSGSPYLPGREAADAAPSDADRVGHGAALGRFLRALHDVDPGTVTAGGAALPVDPGAARRHAPPRGRRPPSLRGSCKAPACGRRRRGWRRCSTGPSGWIRRRRWPWCTATCTCATC